MFSFLKHVNTANLMSLLFGHDLNLLSGSGFYYILWIEIIL
jgi:hypothetical protein